MVRRLIKKSSIVKFELYGSTTKKDKIKKASLGIVLSLLLVDLYTILISNKIYNLSQFSNFRLVEHFIPARSEQKLKRSNGLFLSIT